MASTPSALYWGTDYWMGTNFIVRHYPESIIRTAVDAGELRRNPIQGMASLAGRNTHYVWDRQ